MRPERRVPRRPAPGRALGLERASSRPRSDPLPERGPHQMHGSLTRGVSY
jgi:hypothetical protein